MENRLRRLFCYYVLSGLFFLTMISGVIISTRYERFLSDILKELEKGRQNLFVMRGAIADMDIAIAGVNKVISPDIILETPETQLLTGLDELKSKMKKAEITVTAFQYKGDEVNLPVVIKATLENYTDFVNAVGYLQSQRFPVFDISNILLSQSQDKTVSYEIRGDIRALKGRKK
ncbi:MAG: hypothetical protein HY754_10760 [Nitrospirae bacterium]|nr:hypothetical protein [Nitrospirota bacterium]